MSRSTVFCKIILVSLLILVSIFPIRSVSAGTNIWTSIGPYGQVIRALAMSWETNTLYVGYLNGRVSKSTNGGGTWDEVDIGLTTTHVNTLAIDPFSPNTLYAGTNGHGVFKSTNGGEKWEAVNTGLFAADCYVYSLALNPATPNQLIVGTDNGIYRSTNGGEKWERIPYNLSFDSLVIDPATPSTIYAGAGNAVFKSTNAGRNWEEFKIGLTNTDVRTLAIDPTIPTLLYAGTDDGVYRSANSGVNWEAFNTGLANTNVRALAIDPATPTTLYVGTGDGVYRSTNRGVNWEVFNTGLTHTGVFALAIDPATPTTLYAGTYSDGGVFVIHQVQLQLSINKAGTGSGTVSSNPVGINCGYACSVPFNTSVTLTATPTTDSTFTGWSGGGCSGTGTCTVIMDTAKSVTANFTMNTFMLSVNKAGTGSGTVSSNPVGINCGSACSVPFNTSVTLTATPTTGSTFTGWSGGCSGTGTCTVIMDTAKSVTANFTMNTFMLSVNKTGMGRGTVSSNPAGIDCGADCSETYNYNISITLSATNSPGSIFTGWSGSGCSGTSTCTVILNSAKSITANYSLDPDLIYLCLPSVLVLLVIGLIALIRKRKHS